MVHLPAPEQTSRANDHCQVVQLLLAPDFTKRMIYTLKVNNFFRLLVLYEGMILAHNLQCIWWKLETVVEVGDHQEVMQLLTLAKIEGP